MKKNNLKVIAGLTAAMMMLTTGCAKDNAAKSHQIAIQFGSYTSVKHKILRLFLPEAKAAVSSLNLCFKRLRFKTADDPATTTDPVADGDNIDFNLGAVDISSGATALGTISLPEGNYTRIEFDLENDCASGKSISIVNSNGSYSSTDRITIKFEGQFTANADGVLTLGVQQIIDGLNSYNGGSTLKATTESISGVLSN
ncbi:MAG: hypothetical protein NDI63_04630 [Pseudobdellovibrio sp.]|nr:hypothetical protein [Pseudobdellovibrio sp.]